MEMLIDFLHPGVILRAVLIMSAAGSLLAALFFALKPLVRERLPKSFQYYIWLVVLAALLTPFSTFIMLPAKPARITPVPVTMISDTFGNIVFTKSEETARINVITAQYGSDEVKISAAVSPPLWQNIRSLVMPLWALGALVFFGINMLGYMRFAKNLQRRRLPATAADMAVLAKLSGGGAPKLYRSSHVSTPMLIGLFSPAIIIPDKEYAHVQLQNILLHELTHWRRQDVLVKWLSVLAGALHWFNPFVRFIRREIDRACELSCDEVVIHNLDHESKQSYGDTLIAMVADSKTPQVVLSTTMCAEKKALKERLGSIMKSKKHSRMAVAFSVILLAAVICVACVLGSSSAKDGATPPGSQPPAPSVEYASTDDSITIQGAQYSTSLTELVLSGVDLQDEDIVPLQYMTNLQSLSLYASQISDLTPLSGLTALTSLSLYDGQISDLTPLTGLTNLAHLYLCGNPISDLTPLSGLPNLTKLHLIRNQISDLTPLSGLTDLEFLYLSDIPISDLTTLSGLTDLEFLYLDNIAISDLTPLAGLTNLTGLGLYYSQISYLTLLSRLTKLTDFSIVNNQASDLSPLADIAYLDNVSLFNNQISDLSPLAGLKHLQRLELPNNQISDLSPLAGLKNLQFLDLSSNPISDWSPVGHVPIVSGRE